MIKLEDFDIEYLKASNHWINDEDIQKSIDATPITYENQLKWFESLKNNDSYKIWGVSYNGSPIGACGIKNCTTFDGEYWGYIGEKHYWGKGLGFEILKLVQDKAISFQLKSLWLKVLKENFRAIKLYEKFNFSTERISDKYYFMRKHLL